MHRGKVLGDIGFPAPGSTLALARAPPIRCSFLRARPETRLSGQSSRGVRPSLTVFPAVSTTGLSTDGTSLGVRCPYSALGGESPRPAPFREPVPWCPRIRRRVPPRRLRCRSQVFSTSQRPSSSPRRPAIFRQVALVGFRPSGGCSSRTASTARRRRPALLTFLPRLALPRS